MDDFAFNEEFIRAQEDVVDGDYDPPDDDDLPYIMGWFEAR